MDRPREVSRDDRPYDDQSGSATPDMDRSTVDADPDALDGLH